MTTFATSRHIGATTKSIFEIIDDPKTIALLSPITVGVGTGRRTFRRVGDLFDINFTVAGIRFGEKFRITHYKKPFFVEVAFNGLVEGVLDFSLLEIKRDYVKVISFLNYEVSRGGPVGKMEDLLLLHEGLKHGLETLMDNLKNMSEEGVAAVPRTL